MITPAEIDTNTANRKGDMFTRTKRATNQVYCFWDIETFVKKTDVGDKMPFRLSCSRIVTIRKNGTTKKSPYKQCNSKEELQQHFLSVIKSHKTLTFLAHNTGFDLRNSDMLKFLVENGFVIKSYYNKATTVVIILKSKKEKVVFIDTMNWFSAPLDSFCKVTGIDKIDVDFENCNDDQLYAHCKADVRILIKLISQYKAIIFDKFHKNIGYTRGSDIIGVWKNTPQAKNVIHNNNADVLSDEINAYYGARVECFRLGEQERQNYYKLDINSLYPSVMVDSKYSTRYLGSDTKVKCSALPDLLARYNLLAHVRVQTNTPMLPQRGKMGIYFPTGEFDTWLCGDELKEAVDRNMVRKVYKIHKYLAGDIFSALITKLYDMRLEAKEDGNEPLQACVKLLMNSLYGKFGQRTGDLELIDTIESMDYGTVLRKNKYSDIVEYLKVVNHNIYSETNNKMTAHTSPIIASEITANARMRLFKLIEVCGIDNLYYCDTDSIFTNSTGYTKILHYIDHTKLGYLKLEGVTQDMAIWGAKHYYFGGKRTLKGVPKNAIVNNDGSFTFNSFKSLHSSMFGNKDDGLDTKIVTKEMTGLYHKGLITRNKTVIPWAI